MNRAECEELMSRYLIGELDAPEHELLAANLREDPAALRDAARVLLIERLLRQQAEVDEAAFIKECEYRIHDKSSGRHFSDQVMEKVKSSNRQSNQTAKRASQKIMRSDRVHRRTRSSTRRWGMLAAACLIAAFAVALNLPGLMPEETGATLKALRGEVSVLRAGHVHQVSKMTSIAVQSGDSIVCGIGASGRLSYADSASVTLREQTELSLGEVTGGKRIDLMRGVIDTAVAKQPEGQAMIFGTPHARISVVGTAFMLACGPASTRLDMIEGEVSLRETRTGASRIVLGGYYCEIGDRGTSLLARSDSDQSPFGGEAWAIPGTIEAEDYDTGGAEVSCHDSDPISRGDFYRKDGVDITTNRGSTDPTDESPIVGWTQAGEWLEYTVDVAMPGEYIIEARVASLDSNGKFHIEFNGVDKTGSITLPEHTGVLTNVGSTDMPVFRGDAVWWTITRTVSLQAGRQVMRIVFDENGTRNYEVANLNHLRFVRQPTNKTSR
jgi:ferric-dicitrate binding protein FerR (iron transport regulator)